jgi:hypothetical protein
MIPGISKIYHGGGIGKGGFPASSTPAPPITHYVASGESEGESITTNVDFVNKLTVTFNATLGVRYMIQACCEIGAVQDEDVKVQLTINGTEYMTGLLKNFPYTTGYGQWNGSFYQSNTLTGAQEIKINWRNAYGAGNKYIKRARILITRID